MSPPNLPSCYAAERTKKQIPSTKWHFRNWVLVVGIWSFCGIVGGIPALGQAQERPPEFPKAEEVADMLEREPLTLQNWPAWRRRLLAWIEDRGEGTTPAYVPISPRWAAQGRLFHRLWFHFGKLAATRDRFAPAR